jgi:hypothetical protein
MSSLCDISLIEHRDKFNFIEVCPEMSQRELTLEYKRYLSLASVILHFLLVTYLVHC